MMAREPNGTLWYYAASGNPNQPSRFGGGWQIYNRKLGVADVTGDGKSDLVGRDSAGVLWLYAGTGNPAAPFKARKTVGTGWQIYSTHQGPQLRRQGRHGRLGQVRNPVAVQRHRQHRCTTRRPHHDQRGCVNLTADLGC
jgi:hypothetical protein